MNNKWHVRFLSLADHIASWSYDPSSTVGAVIVRPNRTISSLGYNGFPRGVCDSDERYKSRSTKYNFICHAEANAIVSASENLSGHTIYSNLFPCNECSKLIIQSGISKVVTRKPDKEFKERWKESLEVSETMFKEANVEIIYA